MFFLKQKKKDLELLAGVAEYDGSILASGQYPAQLLNVTKDVFTQLVNLIEKSFHNFDVKNVSEFYLQNIDTNDANAMKWTFYRLFGDLLITCPTYKFAQSYGTYSHKSNVYFYEITYQRTDENKLQSYGVTHGADIDFVFGLPLIQHNPNDTNIDIEFSYEVMKIWTDFAKYG